MASTFRRKNAIAAPAAARTLVYTCPTVLSTIVFEGQITNIAADKASHFVTLEIFNGVSYEAIFKELEVPYGMACPLPKQVMNTGETMHISCVDSVSNALEIGIQLVERT